MSNEIGWGWCPLEMAVGGNGRSKVIKGVVFNPRIWVEDASELSENVEPLVPALKPIRGTACSRPASVGAATRSVPAPRSTTTSGLEWPALLATMAAELSKDGVDPPCFPESVVKIHAAFNEPKTSIDDLLRLIRAEPRMGELLVVLANAALQRVDQLHRTLLA
jgi:hypothetical protein